MSAWSPMLLLLLALPADPAAGPAAGGEAPAVSGATKDRLPEERMEALVAYPMALVRRGRADEGAAAFEKLLRFRAAKYGANSVDQADLLTAFGILAYMHFQSEERDAPRRRALPYLRRAVATYRAALGDLHPETALALNTYADALLQTHEEPPREAEAALEEALAIRTGALGPGHIETVSGMAKLAELKTHPARIGKDVDATAALLRRLLEVVPRDGGEGPLSDPLAVRVRLAKLYIVNRRVADALEVVEEAKRRGHGLCRDYGGFIPADSLPEMVARVLEEEGHAGEAARLKRRYPRICGPAPRRH